MLTFFRKLRRSLLDQNRVSRYLLYALGEIALVVIGILIALQINNWNEERMRDVERIDLYMSLQNDFRDTQVLLDSGMKQSKEGIRRIEAFLNAAGTIPEQHPVDSLQYWTGGAFDAVLVDAVLTSYEEAVSTGRISLIRSHELMEQMSGFLRAYNFYQDHLDFSGEIFYLGSIYELRRQVGSIGILGGPLYDSTYKRKLAYPRFALSAAEFYELVKRPQTYAALENMLDAHYMMRDILAEMDARLTGALKILDTMVEGPEP